MTHSKKSHSISFVAALAAFAVMAIAGCAMNTGEPNVDEPSVESTEADLRKAPVANVTDKHALSDNSDENAAKVILPKAAIAPQLISNDPLLGGGQDEDGPRPHPWSPAPETNEANTNSGSSNGSSSSSSSQ